MSLWTAITGSNDTRTGQQRRAAANRKADRDGHAEMDRYPSSQSTTAWHNPPPRRAWWRSN
jgi:hypothetical protein